MNIVDARALRQGDKVMCAEIQACALEGICDLYEWEVVSVWDHPTTVRVYMQNAEYTQVAVHQNIANKVGAA